MPLADDLLAVLNDPTHMWVHALRQLSADSRRLFLSLALLPKPVSADVLQIAYTAQEATRNESFLDSLRSIEDSFVKIEQQQYGDARLVEFKNPSLQDFAYMYLDENTEFLGVLLRSPIFFEQIITTFTLAMAQSTQFHGGTDRSKLRSEPKYPGIKRWVERRGIKLIEVAVDLLDSDNSEVYRYVDRSRLSQFMSVIVNYSISDSVLRLAKLHEAVVAELAPKRRLEARVIVRLLENPNYRRVLDEVIKGDSAAILRENIIDKDGWKFEILGKLDVVLELDRERIWDTWGEDYVSYARDLVERLSGGEDTDEGDLYTAIKEITEMADMLDFDMSDELATLDDQRELLARLEAEAYDETRNDSSQSQNEEEEDNASLELGRIFATLL